MPFSNKKLLLLLFNFCSLGTLDLQSSNDDPSTRSNHRATIQSKQEDTSKNNTPNQKKNFKKNVLKDRAHGYGYENARNTENEATVEKKQLSEDLYYNRIENYKLDLF